MKKLAFALLFTMSAVCCAQDAPQEAAQTHAYAAACGSVDDKLEADTQSRPAPPQPDEMHAVVYLIQQQDQTNFACLTKKCGGADLRIGMDGKWVGATSGSSYVAVPVDPGAHHLCVNWQSHFKKLSHREVYLHSLHAEANHIYYFRIHVSQGSGGGEAAVPFSISLDPVDEDEAKLLLELEPLSVIKKP